MVLHLHHQQKKIKLSYENNYILEFENYKKGFLPSVAFSQVSVNFKRFAKACKMQKMGITHM